MSATLSIIGITLSVATLILVMSVMNGFRVELIEKILGINAHIGLYSKYERGITDYETKTAIVRKIPHVSSVYPVMDGQGMLINKQREKSSAVMIKGISSKSMQKKLPLLKTLRGSVEHSENKKDSIILGSSLAMQLQTDVGKTVTLVGAHVNETPFGSIPRYKNYKVEAIISTGMPDYDHTIAFVKLSDAQLFYHMKDMVNIIEVNTSNPEKIDIVRDAIKALPELNGLRIIDWQQENHSLMQALKMESNVMLLIMILFVIVAMLTILVSLTMLVNEKCKSIAILSSMGLTRINIAGVFFITSITIVISGITLGTITGVSLASNIDNIRLFLEKNFHATIFDGAIYLLSTIPSSVRWHEVITLVLSVFSFGIFTSIVPAIRATKINPANTLRYF